MTVKGKPGRHRVLLSYLVSRVRWVPSYDLRYDDVKQIVEASYYATVAQGTGEDWGPARLSFSTALPGHLVAVPELPTWTLGRTHDFTPTPRERSEPPQLRWVAPAPAPRGEPAVDLLGQALQAAQTTPESVVSASPTDFPRWAAPAERAPDGQIRREGVRYGKQTVYNFDEDVVQGDLVRPDGEFVDSRSRARLGGNP